MFRFAQHDRISNIALRATFSVLERSAGHRLGQLHV
jgi:hypothetical protein